ncbi:EamA family transporter [Alphaproteobacteria bacterium GH1-50]|uniref:EamA family transporter n=1 Tax=Kangsaoukella pontilimi TaxID=2691042 RepID=A0A7C9J1A2_9RHOB|nr:EamA family transporter [Kangsaoukella pontilimi]MXQ06681.1 EamA family transporter [Kangsaoukella pontilimi]
MSDWILSLEGTPSGETLALILAVQAAFLHALFGALQKRVTDPWTARSVIDATYAAMAAPFALFYFGTPDPALWPLLAIAWVIHLGYKAMQAAAYSVGAYTVVYPVVRGTGPVFTVFGAGLLFGEVFSAVQWLGVAALVAGILGLALYNLKHVTLDRARLPMALGLAVITGGFVAAYTTWDAYVIRAFENPFAFLAWFFFLDGLAFPAIYLARHRGRLPRPLKRHAILGVQGAVTAYFSFGGILLATRLDKVGEAAVLRETSVVFAALIGWLMLGEKVGPRRLSLMALIALGAVIVEMGG